MQSATLEQLNITVSDPGTTAAWLGGVFGWRVRWQGEARDRGHTIHVGTDRAYVALYRPQAAPAPPAEVSCTHTGGLNHWAVVVDDLDATEHRVKAEGFTPRMHADYEPGRRFYFRDGDGIEVEVVAYP